MIEMLVGAFDDDGILWLSVYRNGVAVTDVDDKGCRVEVDIALVVGLDSQRFFMVVAIFIALTDDWLCHKQHTQI